MIIWVVLSITILYFLFAILRQTIKKIIGRKICAVCAAVSLTWLGLLFLWLVGFNINPLIIAVLMGQSIVGVMYQSEEYFKQKKLKKLWLVRILIIVLGTLAVYFLLEKLWYQLFVLVVLSFILAPLLWTMIVKLKKEKGEIKKTSKAFKKAAFDLEKLMEDCC